MTDTTVTHAATVIRCYVGGYRRHVAKCACGSRSDPCWTETAAQLAADRHNRRTA